MKTTLLQKLCCPQDKMELSLKTFAKNEQGDIIEGLLTCSTCNRFFPIIYGIPIMAPDEYREKSLEEPIMKRWGIDMEDNSTPFFLSKEVDL